MTTPNFSSCQIDKAQPLTTPLHIGVRSPEYRKSRNVREAVLHKLSEYADAIASCPDLTRVSVDVKMSTGGTVRGCFVSIEGGGMGKR